MSNNPDTDKLERLLAEATPGPWEPCQHLKSVADDLACSCGYRGVIFGPDHDVAYAICQPGHQPAPKGQEGTEPARYPREVEIANSQLIALAPDLAAEVVRLRKVEAAARRLLEWWPEGSQNGSAASRMGIGFGDDLAALRASLPEKKP
jgi:hypothetical protein